MRNCTRTLAIAGPTPERPSVGRLQAHRTSNSELCAAALSHAVAIAGPNPKIARPRGDNTDGSHDWPPYFENPRHATCGTARPCAVTSIRHPARHAREQRPSQNRKVVWLDRIYSTKSSASTIEEHHCCATRPLANDSSSAKSLGWPVCSKIHGVPTCGTLPSRGQHSNDNRNIAS